MDKKEKLKEDNARIPRLLEEFERLSGEVQDIKYQNDQLSKKVEQTREERDETSKKLDHSEREAMDLAQRLDDLTAEFEKFKKKHESCYEENDILRKVNLFFLSACHILFF